MAITFSDTERRQRLRLLDQCLETLEREHERGRNRVAPPLAKVIKEHVPGVRAGMLVVDAIDEVLLEQKPLMAEAADRPRGVRSRSSYLPRHKRDTYFTDLEALGDEEAELGPVAESA